MYLPEEDSYLVQKHIKEFCNPKSDSFSVLDMGTGSGIQAFEASKYAKKVIACDIDAKAITLLKKNIKTKRKMFPYFVRISPLESDLFSKIHKKQKFDLIIFNPPYLPSKKNEFKYIDIDGGKNGTKIIEKFLKQAKKFLKINGNILLLTSSLNKNIESIFKKYHYKYFLLDEEKFFFEKLFLWLLE